MINFLWYVGIAAISITIAAYAMYMKRNTYKLSTLIVFYIFSSSITWFGEFTVLGLFNSYAYKTDLFQSPWAQNLIGHLLLNTSMFPASAIVMVSYSLGYGMIAITTIVFVLVEYIFVQLGLYEQHWWRYYMSAINIIAFMLITKKWFSLIMNNCSQRIRTVTFYFVAFLFVHIPSPLLLLTGRQHYQLGIINNIFHDFYLSSIVIAYASHILICFLHIYFICVRKKWYWKIVPFILSITMVTLYAYFNILIMDNGWKLIYSILIQEFFLALFIVIENFSLKSNDC